MTTQNTRTDQAAGAVVALAVAFIGARDDDSALALLDGLEESVSGQDCPAAIREVVSNFAGQARFETGWRYFLPGFGTAIRLAARREVDAETAAQMVELQAALEAGYTAWSIANPERCGQ